ncbi:MAG: hypothetical protein IT163_18655 [Bryobacterales bacterium]|nr:hypothetical protein [Bryobacterales bacterium]
MGGLSGYYAMAISVAVVGAVSWVVIGKLGLTGPMEIVIRSLLMGLLMSLFGIGTWWKERQRRRKQAAQAEAGGAPAGAAQEEDLSFLFKAAEQRLMASPLGADARVRNLPVVFLVGAGGAAKTSTLIHSGVEPDLLAGQVYQDNTVVPTAAANLWLAQRSVFIEAGGKLFNDAMGWTGLIKRLKPSRLRSLFSRKPQPPRAVVVCVDGESFLRGGAEDALTGLARTLNARVCEISKDLGIRLPIYVLFTRMDRMGYFGEFVSNLSDEEAMQVVGSTLPIQSGVAAGVYAETESRRLTAAFNDLFFSICDKRLPMLEREHDPVRQGAVYEFPREFRKLRQLLVRFLADLGRPSQLHISPFLRGFYFSGVRPKVIKETAGVRTAETPASMRRGGLVDDPLGLDAPHQVQQQAQSVRTRRVPQWIFLGHLFSNVILQDRAAQGASGTSAGAQMTRRLAVSVVSALFFLWMIALTVSYFGNRALETQVIDAARGIAATESGGAGQELPSLNALQRLDTLRQSVELLSRYEREGAPWRLRWGLYVGSDMYESSRRLYFNRFAKLLFGATQAALLDWLRKLPASPGPSDPYRPTYDTLKGYLITTSHPDKSTREFLSPLLTERWAAGRQVDPDRMALARRQFDFYADELKIKNPFSSSNDGEAIEHARDYLSRFNAEESIYQFMIAEASRKHPGVNFNKAYPGSAALVVNNREMLGAFTADGWKFMEEAIRNVRRFFGGERWVLGDRAVAGLDPATLAPKLTARYHKDFLDNWRAYLAATQVVRYASIADAAAKLGQLSGNSSYLLALFCVASTNTAVAAAEVKAPYQPVHFVEQTPCRDRMVTDNNTPYVQALVGLQAAMDRVAKTSGNEIPEDLVNATLNEATNAYKVTRMIAQKFTIDREGNVHGMVQKLMEDPIKYAEALLGRLGPAQLNSAGKGACNDLLKLTAKYPFKSDSKLDATMEEFGSFFRPGDGRLDQFYQGTLKQYIDKQGSMYVQKADSKVSVTPRFLQYLNNIMAFREAFYKGEARDPKLAYSMKALPAEGLKGVTLTLDGQTLKGSGKGGETREFNWPGAGGAQLSGNLGGGDIGLISYSGLWSAFRFFGDYDRFESSGARYTLSWVPRQGQSGQAMKLGNGKDLTIPFELDMKGAPPIFRKGYLASLGCVSEVAR